MWQFHKKQLVQELLHQIKYGGQPRLAVELGEILASRLVKSVEIPDLVVLVPVPLHPKRLKKRGYNQAERIAAGVAKVTGWPVLPDKALIRTKNTRTQTGFSLDMRQKNIAQAFELRYQGSQYELAIVIDDVFTTGATVFELCRHLTPALSKHTAVATLALA
jgi:ComF family protein